MQWWWSRTPILLQMLTVMLPHSVIWASSKLKLPYLSIKKQSVAFTNSEDFSTRLLGECRALSLKLPSSTSLYEEFDKSIVHTLAPTSSASVSLEHEFGNQKTLNCNGSLSLVSHETLLNLIFLIHKKKKKKNSPDIIYRRWGFSETVRSVPFSAQYAVHSGRHLLLICQLPILGAASLHWRRSGRSSQGLCSAIFPGNSGNTVVLSLVSTQFASICRNAPVSIWQQPLWDSKYLSTGKDCEFGKGEKTIK